VVAQGSAFDQRAPCAFERVDPGSQAQDLRRALDGVESEHAPSSTPDCTPSRFIATKAAIYAQ